jgi:hypothetical protein
MQLPSQENVTASLRLLPSATEHLNNWPHPVAHNYQEPVPSLPPSGHQFAAHSYANQWWQPAANAVSTSDQEILPLGPFANVPSTPPPMKPTAAGFLPVPVSRRMRTMSGTTGRSLHIPRSSIYWPTPITPTRWNIPHKLTGMTTWSTKHTSILLARTIIRRKSNGL